MVSEEYPLPPELEIGLPYRKSFTPDVEGESVDAFRGWVMERTFYCERRPYGSCIPIIDYMKFDDGSYALRFWQYKWIKKEGKFSMTKGTLLREDNIEALKEKIKDAFAIKSLIKKFVE